MSPKPGGRARRRQRRNLLLSVIVVVAITLGSFAAVVAARWSPRLGLDLAGGVAVVYTAEGQHISQADLDETVNILNLRVNGLGVSGARGPEHREEPDLGLHPRSDRRTAGARPDRADGAHVLPARSVLRVSPSRAQGLEDEGPATQRRVRPALRHLLRAECRQPRRHPEQLGPGLHLQQHPPGPTVHEHPLDQCRQARLRGQHRAPARPGRQRQRRRALRARSQPDDRPRHQQRHGDPEPDRRMGGGLQPGRVGELGPLGQGGGGELPPAAGHRARWRGVLGADHPAVAVRLHLLRRTRRDLGEPDAAGRPEPGPGDEFGALP